MLSIRLASPAALLLLVAGLPSVLVDAKPSPFTTRDDPGSIGPIGDITWEGELEPGKGSVALTGGTFEAIEQQAKALNSTYTIFQNPSANTNTSHPQVSLGGIRSTDCLRDKLPAAKVSWILAGAAHMREIGGTCWLSGRLCMRAVCQRDSAIFWCNDNVGRLGAACATLADYADYLYERCSDDRSTMQGSVTDDRNRRTIVRGDDCQCIGACSCITVAAESMGAQKYREWTAGIGSGRHKVKTVGSYSMERLER
ncbi:hypothetical protein MAPG_12106 [Magnaporthiopsis poae ATCC 64411]|uniref:Ig-like domain-containing protein n=1 Tax=Magnaporthiopsis poae (strain ATCC 64411 / 73-15) TaxID=644358 RepID=A0A0C4EGV0_MAGP6|nr:hypothetical protein MAPG_12106 [Magnaporthiopsis poae ATCC 64411]